MFFVTIPYFSLDMEQQKSTESVLSQEEVEKMLQDEDDAGAVGTGTDMHPPPSKPLDSAGTSTDGNQQPRFRSASSSTTSGMSSTGGTGRLPKAYYNVRAARLDIDTVRPLVGSEVQNLNKLGSFINDSDDRYRLANHRHCFNSKKNISTSFEIESFTCNTCTERGGHRVLRRETERPDTVDDSPICFVLSDQCCPPVLPPEAQGECIKIVRIEDGGIMELITTFLEMTKGFVIPAGSVLVVSSASYLARIGTESYAGEFDNAKNYLFKVMGGGGYAAWLPHPLSGH
jgi:hypothetical protein